MAKTVRCETCGVECANKNLLRDHERSEVHRAKLERLRDEDNAMHVWRHAHRPAVTEHFSCVAVVAAGLRAAGVPERMAELVASELWSQNNDVTRGTARLVDAANNMAERLKRDIGRVATRGSAAAVVHLCGLQNGNAVADMALLEGKVSGATEALAAMSRAVGVRCQATEEAKQWRFLEALGGCTAEMEPRDGSHVAVVLRNPAWSSEPMGEFETLNAAVLAAVNRVRAVAENLEAVAGA